jgi:alanyl-tRNA synthetase
MSGNEIRAKYLAFMEAHGHIIVPSAALVPENDPTTLFTGSGMQSMVPYLLGETHPMGSRVTDSQKCFRADDIEEVGDNRHTTFFEMLGNWSFGDYTKADQINWMFQFLINELKLNPERLYISVFGGDEKNNLSRDIEAPALWKSLFETKGITAEIADIGTEAHGYERGMKDGERIFYYEAKKNWWSRAGIPDNMPIGEPGGPDSEMFYDFGTKHDTIWGEHCHPNCDCGRFMEIGNNVFMEYVKTDDNEFSELKSKNIDFGGGLERIAAAVNNEPDVFKVDLLKEVVTHVEKLSSTLYETNKVAFRVITDHIRGTVFMIGDNVLPSNTEQGYFVRRLIRRAVRYADMLKIPAGELASLARTVIDTYKDHFTNLGEKRDTIIETIQTEETQFRKTLELGLKEFSKISLRINVPSQDHADDRFTVPVKLKDRVVYVEQKSKVEGEKHISGKNAFELFTTYGFPIELTEEIAKERGLTVDRKTFDALMLEHRELSRKGAEQKFKGGLADHSEKVVMYHTATHLLLAGLRNELGSGVHQAGSNITGERLRFDFTHPERVSTEALSRVETFVNNAIHAKAHVTVEIRSKEEAQEDSSIEGSFWERYPDEVKVYTIKDENGVVYSRELCGGPHVEDTSNIVGTFKIIKEESSSQGVRRIKAVLE